MDLSELWALNANQFPLAPHSLHGPDHWQRVERNGLEIAQHNGADILIVRLFAVFHDSRRQNEMHDPQHGQRAADYAASLRGNYFTLNDSQFDLFRQACILHDKGQVSDDPTIGACWDADRLDLPRVNITPAASFMSTAYGKLRCR
jgi:uncharacterized protein